MVAEKKKKVLSEKGQRREVDKIFKSAASSAAQMIVETVQNDDVKTEIRLKCASIILEKVFGKEAVQEGASDTKKIVVELAQGLEGYAE